MQIINATEMLVDYAMGMNPDGGEMLIVVVKGTFTIPLAGEPAVLAAEQQPLASEDTFTGEPGFSAPIYEADYPLHKPRCDVILHGNAYVPGGVATNLVRVGLRVGTMIKTFNVVGNRSWRGGISGPGATPSAPFEKMTISYDNAFGGVDSLLPDETKHQTYLENHAGRGFYAGSSNPLIDGKALPNTEEIGKPVSSPDGIYRPMAFGPVGRSWGDRPRLAGTYDQHWLDEVFPFLPADFDDAYNQSVPPDQQIPYPTGGEEVQLLNLTAEGSTGFSLPPLALPIEFSLRWGERKKQAAVVDTLIIEPDRDRFIVCWRATLPLKQNMFDVNQLVIGNMPRGWYRAREVGKPYYRSLAALVDSRRE